MSISQQPPCSNEKEKLTLEQHEVFQAINQRVTSANLKKFCELNPFQPKFKGSSNPGSKVQKPGRTRFRTVHNLNRFKNPDSDVQV